MLRTNFRRERLDAHERLLVDVEEGAEVCLQQLEVAACRQLVGNHVEKKAELLALVVHRQGPDFEVNGWGPRMSVCRSKSVAANLSHQTSTLDQASTSHK